MIGNKYLAQFYSYSDRDTGINQLLELLKYKDPSFISSLKKEEEDLDLYTEDELVYITIVSGLIDYYFQLHGLNIPKWLRDKRLEFEKPYFHPKRLSDFEKLKLQITNPGPFRRRNIYFDLDGLGRV